MTDKKKPNRAPVDERIKVKARALWEGDPTATFDSVGKITGTSKASVSRWAKAEQWEKLKPDMQGLMAHRAVDHYEKRLDEYGPDLTEAQKLEAQAKASQDTAVEMRDAVLERHRKEWGAPRKLSYEAIQNNNFEKAKLAKITAETLMLIQSGERKAWNLDTKPTDQKPDPKTIVIERE